MAVYTRLHAETVDRMLALYASVGEVRSIVGMAQGSINTTFRIEADGGVFFLRVNEGKSMEAIAFERDVLDALSARGTRLGHVETPRLLRNSIRGAFYPIDDAGPPRRYASLFAGLDGRELAVFEVEPDHCRQIGLFLGRAHGALRRRAPVRANPYGLPVVQRWLADLKAPPAHVAEAVQQVRRVVEGVARRRRRLPRGLVHGDLFIDNTKWKRGALHAVFDWEMAGRDHLAYDVGVALCAWAWQRNEDGSGAFVAARARALVDGYRAVRRFTAAEARGLYDETLLAAARFTLSRIRDFELGGPRGVDGEGVVERAYLDHRDFLRRVTALQAMTARGFSALVGLSGTP